MLKQETMQINGKDFIHTWSDADKYILQKETNILYSDAIDISPCPYTYEESDQSIEMDEEEGSSSQEYKEAFDILVGEGE